MAKLEIGGTYKLRGNQLIRTNAPAIRHTQRDAKTQRFTSLRTKIKRLWYLTKVTVLMLAMLSIAAVIGYALHGNTITTTNTTVIAAPVKISFPILDRIAAAESHKSQTCTAQLVALKMCHSYEIGGVLRRVNSNGTYDTGYYQINSTHIADALALGYNIDTQEGNTAYAQYLFEHQGSEPWSASKAEWNK